MKIFNCKITKNRRRELRKNQTDAERALWNKLRNKQINGYKFFRQFGIDSYIVDFYCPLLKIVVEEAMAYDHRRKECLEKAGIKVIQFNNSDVLKNIEGVFEIIQQEPP